jgi:hypothetical protein
MSARGTDRMESGVDDEQPKAERCQLLPRQGRAARAGAAQLLTPSGAGG